VSLWRHIAVFLALVVNLWVGGDLVEEFAGVAVRVVYELTLIGGWLWLVIGVGGLLRQEPDEPPRGDR
jgi:hypothetical protein